MVHVSHTVYAKQGEHGYEDGCVGITFPHTPSLTKTEVHSLIDQLQEIAREMRAGEPDGCPVCHSKHTGHSHFYAEDGLAVPILKR